MFRLHQQEVRRFLIKLCVSAQLHPDTGWGKRWRRDLQCRAGECWFTRLRNGIKSTQLRILCPGRLRNGDVAVGVFLQRTNARVTEALEFAPLMTIKRLDAFTLCAFDKGVSRIQSSGKARHGYSYHGPTSLRIAGDRNFARGVRGRSIPRGSRGHDSDICSHSIDSMRIRYSLAK